MRNKTRIQAISLMLMTILASSSMAGEDVAATPSATLRNRQVFFRDPLTGESREPTAAEWEQLARAIELEEAAQPRVRASGAASGNRVHWRKVRLPNGREGKLATVPEGLQSHLVIERQADGQYRMHHAQAAAAAQEATP